MPGDPLRAKEIATTFLTDVVLVNQVRGVLGYTGFFKGEKVSVMASGMGIPSICIYAHELFNFYDVKNIIRVGSAGAICSQLNLYDVVIGMGACTDVNYSSFFNVRGCFAPIASFELLKIAADAAKKLQIPTTIGNLLSSAMFYTSEKFEGWREMGVLAVEMEAAGLYSVAAKAQKRALCICTISDLPETGAKTSPEERQTAFTEMVKIALETARSLAV
jgi:purine-nucleoside phosphorylase